MFGILARDESLGIHTCRSDQASALVETMEHQVTRTIRDRYRGATYPDDKACCDMMHAHPLQYNDQTMVNIMVREALEVITNFKAIHHIAPSPGWISANLPEFAEFRRYAGDHGWDPLSQD